MWRSSAATGDHNDDEADEGEYVEPNHKTPPDSQSRTDVEMTAMSPAASSGIRNNAYDDPHHHDSTSTNSRPSTDVSATRKASATDAGNGNEALEDAYENTDDNISSIDSDNDHAYINVEQTSPAAAAAAAAAADDDDDDEGNIDYETVHGYLSLEADPETPPAYENVAPNFSQLSAQ